MPLTEEEIYKELEKIVDPELGINIVDLGLIYAVRIEDNGAIVAVDMTLTSLGCPIGPQLRAAVLAAVRRLPEVKAADVNLVFDPPWDPKTMATEDARDDLGL
jgi:metal-sulfur cluster biosynthetic enzyme